MGDVTTTLLSIAECLWFPKTLPLVSYFSIYCMRVTTLTGNRSQHVPPEEYGNY